MKASFRTKILLLFSGLIAVAQLATIGAVLEATKRAALRRTEETLQVGAAVFREDLEDQKAELLNWVDILSQDFGFIEAVATGEQSTIASALANHAGRVNADLGLVIGLDGVVIASMEKAPHLEGPPQLDALLAKAKREGVAVGIILYGDEPHQVVLLPVYAPLQVAWVCMGFLIDDPVARMLKSKTFLEVSFWAERPGGPPHFLASTLGAEERAVVESAFAAHGHDGGHAPFLLADTDYLTLALPLVEGEQYAIYALLQTSLEKALEGHRALRAQLLLLAAGALFSALLAGILVARSVTRPVQALLAAAQRISAGNYLRPVEVKTGDEMGVLAATFNEMQERIAAREEQIVYQASHDPLTGLFNRAAVSDRLIAAIARARRASASLAVMLLDLDRFKEINDKLGHKIGDLVLRRAAECLRANVRESDTILRLGGDEFLVILENCDERSARLAAASFASKLAHAVELDDMQITLDLSVGISVYPEHGAEPDMLLRRADIALYGAKQERGAIAVYELGQDEKHLRQLALISDLTPALESGEFSLHYQPKVHARTHDVVQVEALLRWNHHEHGPLRADEYIPLAEKSGHIKQITRWVIEAAVAQARSWRQRGLNLGIAVNLSAIDLGDLELPDVVEQCLARHHVPASALVVEVTETSVMQNPAQAVRVLERFRAAGIHIALDDFGTGHSSLAQLKRIPVDELKIDKAFVLQLKEGSEDEVIVRSTVDLGHNMGLLVIAEGVEDQATWTLLESYGCDLLQGHFISPPLSAAAFEVWLEEYYREGTGTRLRVHDAGPDND